MGGVFMVDGPKVYQLPADNIEAARQAALAAAQVSLATTQAGIATTQAGIATTQAGLSAAASIPPINQSLPAMRNLIDPDQVVLGGFYNTGNGTLQSGGSNVGATGPVTCFAGEVFTVAKAALTPTLGVGGAAVTFFNASGYVSHIGGAVALGGSFTAPAGATYWRATMNLYERDYLRAYIHRGSTAAVQFRAFEFLERIGAQALAAKVAKSATPGKTNLLDRAELLKGFTISNTTGLPVAGSANNWATGKFRIDETRGMVSNLPLILTTQGVAFFDADTNYLFNNGDTFTAVLSSSNTIDVTATTSGRPLCLGALVTCATAGKMPPLTASSVYITGVPAGRSATGTYTLSGNALVSETRTDMQSGGLSAGVAMLPPSGFGVTYAATSLFFSMNSKTADEWEIADGPLSVTTATSGATANSQSIGLADLSILFPWFRRPIAILGNSINAGYLADHLGVVTKADIQLQAASSASQMHQSLDGCRLAIDVNNRNAVTGNTTGVLTSADFAGIKAVILGPIGGNEIGYRSGTSLGNDTAGGHRQPYDIGLISDTQPVAVFQVTTTAGGSTVTVSGLESGEIQAGAKFHPSAPGGLAGKSFGTQVSGTAGGNGVWNISSGTGVTALGAAWVTCGTFYGTLHWLCVTKLGAWAPGAMLFLPTTLPRYDCGSGNGSTADPTNPGNPVNTLGFRISDYATALELFCRKNHFIMIDMFWNTPFGVNGVTLKYNNTDLLHPLVTRPGAPVADPGPHLYGGRIGRVMNQFSPLFD